MKLTLRQMEIFLNVVESGHLTQVAKEMGLSQSAISMSIKELENILGRPLFDRINKKLILNELGRAFHKEIIAPYKKFMDIEYEFRNSLDKGIIHVGASTTIVDYLMPQIAFSYMHNYPDVKISLKEGNSKEIAQLILGGAIDMGFVEGVVTHPEIVKVSVAVDELVVVTSDSSLTQEYTIEELAEKRWVLREEGSGTRGVFLDYIKDMKGSLNIVMELGHTESIKSILINNDCMTCVSKIAVQNELNDGVLHQVKIKNFECKRDFLMIYHKDKYQSELFKKFVYFSKSIMTQMLRVE